MAIKLQIKGFDEILESIKKANGDLNKITEQAIKTSAQIVHEELKSQMAKANVDSDLINAMQQPEIEIEGNRYSAKVGFKKGTYNPKDPSAAYKVVFLNYGTPKRSKHGKIAARGFIQKAKRKANPKVKKAQAEAFEAALEGLKNEG